MKTVLLPMLGAVVVCASTAGAASAQVAKSWTSTSPAGVRGEFRDEGNGTWVELQNGNKVFTFREVSRGDARADLFDGSRGIRVVIEGSTCHVKQDGATLFDYRGGWFWKEWHVRGKDIRFVNTTGTTWVEYQNGRPAFTFVATARYNDGRVLLYDNSRGFRVELSRGQARVLEDHTFLFAYTGGYTR